MGKEAICLISHSDPVAPGTDFIAKVSRPEEPNSK